VQWHIEQNEQAAIATEIVDRRRRERNQNNGIHSHPRTTTSTPNSIHPSPSSRASIRGLSTGASQQATLHEEEKLIFEGREIPRERESRPRIANHAKNNQQL